MSARYLALLGGSTDRRMALARHVQACLGLACILDTDAVTFLIEADAARLLAPGNGGLVIGSLFRRSPLAERVRDLTPSLWRELGRAEGRGLIRDFWGSYLALLLEPDGKGVRVLRDPSGEVPCYHTRHHDITVVAGQVRDLDNAGLVSGRVNWAFVARHLHRPGHHGADTGLADVEELLPGHALVWHDLPASGTLVEQFWQPWDHVSAGHVDPSERSAELLEALVDKTIGALAGQFHHIVLNLSGGLDSSIIAAALARAGLQTTCLTLATPDGEGDERYFAQAVADRLGLALEARFYDLADVDVEKPAAPHLPRPTARTFAQGSDRMRQALAQERGAQALFSGDGGDNVFCLMQSATPVVDRLLAEGPSRGVLATLGDMSRLTRCSMVTVARRAMRKYRHRPYSWPSHARYLSPRALALSDTFAWHPWLSPPEGTLPGKAAHAALLVRAQNYPEAYLPGHAPSILPLLAQPLVEFCLSVPTWAWCAYGQNRSVARAAFADRLPASIIGRRTKGGPDSFCVRIVETQRARLGPLLLDGLLAAEGLLDTDALAASLSDPNLGGADHHRLLALADAETWARSWSSS